MSQSVAVIGAGSWGTALAMSLAWGGHDVRLWTRRPEHAEELRNERTNQRYLEDISLPASISVTTDQATAVQGADVWLFAIPSQHQREVAHQFAGWAGPKHILISVAKGIENGTLELATEVLQAACPAADPTRIGVLYGPSHAEEVVRKQPTAVVAAFPDAEVATQVQNLFMTPNLRVYVNTDVVGVQIGGSLKNIMAIATGICDGVGYGDNAKAALITRGIVEMGRLGAAMGAKPSTFAGLSGLGDLVVTCMSGLSRNRHVGEQIGRGRSLEAIREEMNMVAEGVKTTRSVVALADRHGIEMPLTRAVYAILFEGLKPEVAVRGLMTREARQEDDVPAGLFDPQQST